MKQDVTKLWDQNDEKELNWWPVDRFKDFLKFEHSHDVEFKAIHFLITVLEARTERFREKKLNTKYSSFSLIFTVELCDITRYIIVKYKNVYRRI